MVGGGSALLALPVPGVTLDDKEAVNKAPQRDGAPIAEINCMRKHLSAIKGGRPRLRQPRRPCPLRAAGPSPRSV